MGVSFWVLCTRTAPARTRANPDIRRPGAIHMMVMRADRRSPSAPWTHKTCRDHALPRADPPTIRHPPENPPAGPRGLGVGVGAMGAEMQGFRRNTPAHRSRPRRAGRNPLHRGNPADERMGVPPCRAPWARPAAQRPRREPAACRNQARRWLPDPRRGPGRVEPVDGTARPHKPANRQPGQPAARQPGSARERAAIRPDGGDEVPGKARGCAEPVDGTTRPPAHRNPPSVRHRQHRRRPRDHSHRSGRGRGRPAPRG